MRLRRYALGALLLGSATAAWWAPPLLRELEFFAVEHVEVSGAQLLAPHEVLRVSGIEPGHNLWDAPHAWTAALRAHPVIREARVERSLPRTLRVRIEEHRPIALIELGSLRPVTARGELLPVDPARARLDLPLIRGVAVTDAAVTELDAAARRLVAEAARLAELDPQLYARISEVRETAGGELLLVSGFPAAELIVPGGIDAERLRQLRAVLQDVSRRLPQPETAGGPSARVDLRFADQVVVRLPSSS